MKKSVWTRIKEFFLLPANSRSPVRALPYLAVVGILLLVFAGSIAGWTVTNSNTFCGTTCHTMPPQFLTYQHSPHARVTCVECHLGRDIITKQIPRKVGHSHTLIALITNSYEYPIVARQMRPAKDACETCHYPEQFSDDSLREVRSYASDEANTQQSIFLLLKTGGGTKRQGLGYGIHWHVENKVEFYTTDTRFEQTIPYIRVTDTDGKVSEYFDIDSGVTSADVAGKNLKTMDCITCHNRISHSIPSPEAAVDTAIASNRVSATLPFIREKSVELLSATYENMDAANQAFDALPAYYQQNYPEVFAGSLEQIDQAVSFLKDINLQLRYPEQELDWTSHPDNIGHKDSAGCFRCHDGRHFSNDGEAIRLECNLCHSIPSYADPTKFVTEITIERGPEPESHTHTSWIRIHGQAIDMSCASCHPPVTPGVDLTQLRGKKPKPEESFCGNPACHVTEWTFIGEKSGNLKTLLETQLAEVMPTPQPQATIAPVEGAGLTFTRDIQPVLKTRCAACHGSASGMAGLDLTSYEGAKKGTGKEAGFVPSDSGASLIFKIQSAGGHFGQLTAQELATLKAWIDAGAPK